MGPRLDAFRELSVQSVVLMPLRSHGRAAGLLLIGSDDPGRLFDLRDLQMVHSLGYRISLARESASLYEDAQKEIAMRKEAEARMRAFNAELERRVLERTSLLEEATREANSFAYTVAHDLRAPLRAITGFCQALKEDYSAGIDAVGQDYLDRIVAGSRRMDDLIRDLLDYARVNRAEIRLAAVDLDEVLDAVMETMSAELQDRKAALERARPLGRVLAHEPMLHQVITNLLSNALKFTAAGVAPNVEIRSEIWGGRVRLSFKDNGIGIASEHQDRIFGIFERLNRSEDYPGTGIGLAIVRRAVERLGGSVGVQSKPGEGSTFWIELPTA
jgi:signal transduction histidine kinase